MTQCERVLEALKAAPQGILTGGLHRLPYITNFRARVSDLRKQGHVIQCKRMKGTDSSLYTYMGLFPHISYAPDEKHMQWYPIGNGYEVQL